MARSTTPEQPDTAHDPSRGEPAPGPTWTFLTNHAHVLVCLSADANLRGWEIAQRVGITERAAQKIVADLIAEGYLDRERVGRRNTYRVNGDLQLRHPLENRHRVGELLQAVGEPKVRDHQIVIPD